MKKTNKKGFTIVELVIVIAVIAILAGVMIPTFGGIIENANDSKRDQTAKNAYTAYLADHAADGVEDLIVVIEIDDVNYYYTVEDSQIDLKNPAAATAINGKCNYTGEGYSVYYGEHNDGNDADSNCDQCGQAISQ